MCNRLDSIPACEGRTDRWRDRRNRRRTDRRISYDGIVRAMHTASRGKNCVLLKLTTDRHEALRRLFATAELLVVQCQVV